MEGINQRLHPPLSCRISYAVTNMCQPKERCFQHLPGVSNMPLMLDTHRRGFLTD